MITLEPINPVKKVKLHVTAAEAIEKYIKNNDLQTGDKLPSERELAKMLSIGRSSLREALRQLEIVNMVEVVNGKGIFVRNPNNCLNGVNMLIASDEVDYKQIFQVRRALEGLAINLTIDNADQTEIAEMEEVLKDIEFLAEKGVNPTDEDEEFHRLIYYASKNNVLINLLESLSDVYANIWHGKLGDDSVLFDSLSMHRPLFEAIKHRNKQEAITKFQELIEFDLKLLEDYQQAAEK